MQHSIFNFSASLFHFFLVCRKNGISHCEITKVNKVLPFSFLLCSAILSDYLVECSYSFFAVLFDCVRRLEKKGTVHRSALIIIIIMVAVIVKKRVNVSKYVSLYFVDGSTYLFHITKWYRHHLNIYHHHHHQVPLHHYTTASFY